VEVCPTGVFTDKSLRDHYTRKWDLTNSPSVCNNCSVGCNIIIGERYGTVRRILSRYNGDVNGYFLCDRGRFGYEFINSPDRIRKVMARTKDKGGLEEITDESLPSLIVSALKSKKLAGIGSPGASLEANFALEALVGKENFYHGIPDNQYDLIKTAVAILKRTPAHSPSLRDVAGADAILIIGEDPSVSAPMLALAVRQATRNKSFGVAEKAGIPTWNDTAVREMAQNIKSPVFIAAPGRTALDSITEAKYEAPLKEIAQLGFAIASAVDKNSPVPVKSDNSIKEIAQKIAVTLVGAVNPVIITGIHGASDEVLHAAANIVTALCLRGKKPSLSVVFPESNSLGLGLMDGKSFGSLVDAAASGEIETLVILENDLYRRADKEMVDTVFSRCRNIIVLSSLMNDTARRADILLPSGTFAESTGTIVNNEGRAQRYYRVLPYDGYIKDSWRYLSELIDISGSENLPKWIRFDDVVKSLTEAYPFFAKIKEIIPDSEFRIFNEKIARQTLRFSGRTAMNAGVNVSEPKPPEDIDSALSFSMEGFRDVPSPYLVPYYWSPGWNSVQAMNKYMNEPDGVAVDGNPGVLLFDSRTENKPDYFKTE